MRFVLPLLAVLFLPIPSHAMFGFDFDGTVTGGGNGQPASDEWAGKHYTGSISFDETATEVVKPFGDPRYRSYQANGNFLMDFGDRRLVKSGILDITIYNQDSSDGVQVKIFDAELSSPAEPGFGWLSMAYDKGTFNGNTYDNLKTPVVPFAASELTAHYEGGEVWDVWDTRSEFTQTGYHAADGKPYSFQENSAGAAPYVVDKTERTDFGALSDLQGTALVSGGLGMLGLAGLAAFKAGVLA